MAKNLIPQIAQMLGVAIGEEFKIKDKHSEFVSDKTYKFSENALMYFHQEDGNICRIVADSMTLCSLLNGYLEVVILLNGLPVWKHCFGDWLEWWYRQFFLIIPAGIITGCCILVRLRIRRGGVMRWSTLPSG